MLIRIILQIRAVEDTSCTEDADDCRSVVVDLNCVDEFPILASVVSLLSFRPMESLPIHRYIMTQLDPAFVAFPRRIPTLGIVCGYRT